jgi:hypothetical protein
VNASKEEYTNTELILISLEKLIEDRESIWPELCRLVLLHRLEDQDSDEFDYKDAFGPSGLTMQSIIERLNGL